MEGLIYAAIVEANLATVADEIKKERGTKIVITRPKILLVAPPQYWSAAQCHPNLGDLATLVREIMGEVPIEVLLLSLDGSHVVELGTDGSLPRINGDVRLSPVFV